MKQPRPSHPEGVARTDASPGARSLGRCSRCPAGPPSTRTPGSISRRDALRVIGATVLVPIGGSLIAACASAPLPAQWVPLPVDPATLTVDQPVQVALSYSPPAAPTMSPPAPASVWVVLPQDRGVVAYDPRCTHLACAYDWTPASAVFLCRCHQATYAVDGRVLSGPPPRALDRLPVRNAVGGGLEVRLPGDFATPRPSI
jgi:Rieske Fe-S protein